MHLCEIQLDNIPPITSQIELEFNERVNVLVGPNASGKSTILMQLADYLSVGPGSNSTRYIWIGRSPDWPGTETEPALGPGSGGPAVVHIPAVRAELPGLSNEESSDASASKVLKGPFGTASTISVLGLLEEELSQNRPNEERINLKLINLDEAINVAEDCGKEICSEVILKGTDYDHGIGGVLSRSPTRQYTVIHRAREGMITNDKPNHDDTPLGERPLRQPGDDQEPLHFSHLSSGTQLTLLWIRWLALKMAHHYNFEEGWEKQPAILLIDEIENHLHPTWQRRVIPTLLKRFRGLQIFATTHSPFAVAGLKVGQVHLLQRDANGVVTASTNERDVIGWTADEILRTLMGVDEPTDQPTVDRANRLRELRRKESLTREEEKESLELRRQVNRALLAKDDPVDAEEESFDELMQEFLRSRQSDLTQDGD